CLARNGFSPSSTTASRTSSGARSAKWRGGLPRRGADMTSGSGFDSAEGRTERTVMRRSKRGGCRGQGARGRSDGQREQDVHERGGEEHGVQPVQDASVAGQERPHVLQF